MFWWWLKLLLCQIGWHTSVSRTGYLMNTINIANHEQVERPEIVCNECGTYGTIGLRGRAIWRKNAQK
jgi:hypothetical protein